MPKTDSLPKASPGAPAPVCERFRVGMRTSRPVARPKRKRGAWLRRALGGTPETQARLLHRKARMRECTVARRVRRSGCFLSLKGYRNCGSALPSLTFGFQFSVFCFLFSVFCFRFSVFCFLFSVFCFLFSVFGFRFSVFRGFRRPQRRAQPSPVSRPKRPAATARVSVAFLSGVCAGPFVRPC